MYESYYGLSERPFSIAPDPHYLYMSQRHKEAMAHLAYGLQQGGCFIVLTGEVGTGKTTLCRNLLEDLPRDVDIALVLNAKLDELELLQTICDELKIAYQASATQKQLLDAINQHLLDAFAQNRHTVLIIDEAQLLSRNVLEQIRLLTNLETTKQKLLQIILIGQPELNEVLLRQDLRQLAQRVTAKYHLGALAANEVEEYINFRLSVAGRGQPLFTRQALKAIYKLSDGIPRRINVLADQALLSAYSQSINLVDAATVKKAAKEVFISPTPSASGMANGSSSSFWKRPVATAAALFCCVGIGYWLASSGLVTSNQEYVELDGQAPSEQVQPNAILSNQAQPSEGGAFSKLYQESDRVSYATEEINASTDVSSLNLEQSSADQDTQPSVDEQASLNVPTSQSQSRAASIDANETVGLARPVESDISNYLSSEQFSQKLDMSSDQTGRIAALRQLAALWQETLPAQMFKPICAEVEVLDLNCIGVESWEQVQRYNRPLVMVLNHNQNEHRVVLESLADGKATVLLGAERFVVDTQALLDRWSNRALAFWKPPAIGSTVYKQGDADSDVVWLRLTLNQALSKLGLPVLNETASSEFDIDLSQKVFSLQSQFDLNADSVVGVETQILIEDILGGDSPTLYARVEAAE